LQAGRAARFLDSSSHRRVREVPDVPRKKIVDSVRRSDADVQGVG
jgi:hypothetical protein